MTRTKWYQKPIYLMVALALVLSLGLVAVPMAGTVEASPGTYYVATTGDNGNDGESWATAWKTITYAVETGATTTGDVIYVADGVYDEDNNCESFPIDFNTDGVTLLGAGGDTSTVDANGYHRNIFNIWADGVSISDFELRNAKVYDWANTGCGIYMNGADECHISNLEIHNLAMGIDDWTKEPAGIFMENCADDNTFSSIEIYDITSDYQPRGIWCDSCSGNQFTDINIHDIDNTDGAPRENSCAYGIHMKSSSGNTFDEITINSITGGNWSEGIQLSWSHNNTFGDLSISDVYGEKYVYGILLFESSDNTFASSSEIWNIGAASGCSIGIGMEPEYDTSDGSNRNTFESFDVHDTCYGFYISKSDDNFITKSNIHHNIEGVHICSEPNTSVGNILKCNNIYRNRDYGVSKAYSPPVDATGNWWGDASGPSGVGPGSGDAVSGNVTYALWLPLEFQYCEECGGTPPPPVGGEAYPVSRLAILAPWIALIAAIITGTTIIWRRRRAKV